MLGPEFSILFLLLILPLIASLLAINLFIKAGVAKGHAMENRGLLWFIGIFAPFGAIVIGLYVAALADNRPERTAGNALGAGSAYAPAGGTSSNELPAL